MPAPADVLETSYPATDSESAEATLTRLLQRLVGDGVVVAVRRVQPTSGLTDEYGPLAAIRAEQSLAGRAALADVLRALGDTRDALSIRFPQPRLSVSHSDHLAVAVGCRSVHCTGLGVDLELTRAIEPRAARFFLDEQELNRYLPDVEPATTQRLLPLWTVKEAVFKADGDNAGRVLRDYHVTGIRPAPAAHIGSLPVPLTEGRARRADARFHFRGFHLPHQLSRSVGVGDLHLCIAHREGPHPCPIPA